MNNKKWTNEKVEKLKELRKHLTFAEIGKIYNLSKQRIHKILRDYSKVDIKNNKQI